MAKQNTSAKAQDSAWEFKDRRYYLADNYSPLTYSLQSKHHSRKPLLWFDPETRMQKELRYATNMASPIKDEQNGQATLGHIVFKEGYLFVPKENQALQKLLSIYHPHKGIVYNEYDEVVVAVDEISTIELEIDALLLAKGMDPDMAEAILRAEYGSKVSDMTAQELRRDLLLFARKKPALLIELANDDNVQLRNFAIKACEYRIITLSQDQRYFSWADTGRKLVTVPFDENPYSAFAIWLKTDEGVEVYKSIEKKMK